MDAPIPSEQLAPPLVGADDTVAGGMSDWTQATSGQHAASHGGFEMCNAIIGERYHLTHGIGRGKFGKVYEATDISSGEHVAVKVLARVELTGDRQRKAEREWIVASKLQHPNVIQLRDVQVSESHVFLVMELASGNELFDRVSSSGGLSEDQARLYFQQVLSGISYCHDHGVYHRDLKLENLLMASPGSDVVKIMDFGLSKDSTMSIPNTYCGTVSYMAPEVTDLVAGIAVYDGAKADIWSLGVILYVTMCCAYPFGHDGKPEVGGEKAHVVYARIRQRKWKEPELFERCCRPLLRDLIAGMLTVDVSARLSVSEILAHSWMQQGTRYEPTGVIPLADSNSELNLHWCVTTPSSATTGLKVLARPPMNSSLVEHDDDIVNDDGDVGGGVGDMEAGEHLMCEALGLMDDMDGSDSDSCAESM